MRKRFETIADPTPDLGLAYPSGWVLTKMEVAGTLWDGSFNNGQTVRDEMGTFYMIRRWRDGQAFRQYLFGLGAALGNNWYPTRKPRATAIVLRERADFDS